VPDGRGGRSGVPLRPPAQPVRRNDRNHVIEVCLDLDGQMWLMLHCGSRNIGKERVEWHIGVAKTLARNAAPPDKDLVVSLWGTLGPRVLDAPALLPVAARSASAR
jgi:hypothetical protein